MFLWHKVMFLNRYVLFQNPTEFAKEALWTVVDYAAARPGRVKPEVRRIQLVLRMFILFQLVWFIYEYANKTELFSDASTAAVSGLLSQQGTAVISSERPISWRDVVCLKRLHLQKHTHLLRQLLTVCLLSRYLYSVAWRSRVCSCRCSIVRTSCQEWITCQENAPRWPAIANRSEWEWWWHGHSSRPYADLRSVGLND